MAVISTHTLDSVHGTHAGGVGVTLSRIEPSGSRVPIFKRSTDSGGRLSEEVGIAPDHLGAEYELVFQIGPYFDSQAIPTQGVQIVKDVVIRFAMPDANGRYHIPLMLAPNSYSVWWPS